MAELSKAIARLMAERERTQQPEPPTTDSPQLRELLDRLRATVAPGERVLAEGLVRQWLERSGAELLASHSLDELMPLVLAVFRFLQEPAKQEPRVEAEPVPGEPGVVLLRTWMRDRPFIVDTVQETLRQAGARIRRLLHPIFVVERDAAGAVRAISGPGEFGQRESVLHVEAEGASDVAALVDRLRANLTQVIWATDDYGAMRNKAEEIADELRSGSLPRPWSADVDEFAAFLDWLGQKNFVFLGYREYEFRGQGSERIAQVRRGSGLGILRREESSHYFQPRPLPEDLRRRLSEPPLWLVSKTNAESPIHRRAHMDYIGIKQVDHNGIVIGERRFLGLFTARAYAQEPMSIPLLRLKLAHILEAEGAEEGTHSYKQIVAVFNSMPRIELLALRPEQLRERIRTVLALEGKSEVRVAVHLDPLARGAFVLVAVPKERFSNELSSQIEARLMAQLAARFVLESRLALDEASHVRLHFYFAPSGPTVRAVPEVELQAEVSSLLRTWEDRLRAALIERYPAEHAQELARLYLPAFPASYRAATDIATALADIANLEHVRLSGAPEVDLAKAPESSEEPQAGVVKLYLPGEPLVLSDFLPLLENLGFRVLSQDLVVVEVAPVGRVQIHSFSVLDRRGLPLDVRDLAPRMKPAIALLYAGKLDNDGLNALVLRAGLTWRQADLLRAYARHAVQLKLASSRETIVQAIVEAPASARALWEYFQARFDPSLPAPPAERERGLLAECSQRFEASLEAVPHIAQDRLLRALFAVVQATVRTSYFVPHPEPVEPGPIALKFDGRRLPAFGPVQPAFETYVHAPQVEGVHLRAAKVARGGIRLSDRPDDFRTEILALMATQTVKNAVIVPSGAKGGFVIRQRRAGEAADAATGYTTFIEALLEITDNVVHGRVDTPARVVAYDGPDPYLVVAADKGTAGFSDLANEIALRRGFWLGDAFASGGQHGYDHKKQGITARGAWQCVRQHFREMGRNAETESLRVVGIGDMSGDVFGNGLLLSRRFRLQAAFDHRHVFLDPNPDPDLSYAERERLFRLPRSSWADYRPEVLSRGGGVFPRSAKRIALSPEARAMLGLEARDYTGEEIVQAILRMPAGLLWNGGIGTYVKASDEPHAAANDPANDSVRVDARDLRVAVVAEGGNLGFTQRARIEYALAGGHIDTDAIDNSGGVDMSDHEVNLKICLSPLLESGQLRLEDRNALLAEIEPEVIERVLDHNRRQAFVLGVDQYRSQTRLHEFRDLMSQLESEGFLDRRAEHLPDREALRTRRAVFLGLTRPELAVLLAHTKRALQQAVLESRLPDDPFFETFLRGYFPEAVNQRFGLAVRSHLLRREIVAVELANTVVDRLGLTFVHRIARDSGADATTVIRAASLLGPLFDWDTVWQEILTSPAASWETQRRCALALEEGLDRATRWYLETQPSDVPATEMFAAMERAVQPLIQRTPEVFGREGQKQFESWIQELVQQGIAERAARQLALLSRAAEVLDIAEVAAGLEVDSALVAEAYYGVGERLSLHWLRETVRTLPAEDRWERRAVYEVLRDLDAAQRQLTCQVLGCAEAGTGVDHCLARFADLQREGMESVAGLIRDLQAGRRLTLAAAVVATRELLRLAQRGETP